MKMLDESIIKNISIKQILVKYYIMAISRNSNCFLMVIERGLSQRVIIKTKENVPIQPQQVHKVFSL